MSCKVNLIEYNLLMMVSFNKLQRKLQMLHKSFEASGIVVKFEVEVKILMPLGQL
jgi:hypothetical protein